MNKPKCCICGTKIEANGHFCLIRYGIVCMECAEKIKKEKRGGEMEQLTLDIEGFSNESLTDRQTDQPQTLAEKIEKSKQALRLAADMSKTYYNAPLILTYSGGKDSDVMLHLAESCLDSTDFEVLNSHTSVDAPETVYHIREVFKRLNAKGIKTTINYPKDKDGNHETMWTLIPKKKMPPTRLQRYCCSVVNPIYEWTDADVWEYLRQENVKTNPLYERGYHRVGCIGCPLATYKQKIKEFSDYPQYKKAYINAFQKMCDIREAEGKEQRGSWADGESVFNWWIEENKYNVKGQMSLFDDEPQA